MATRPANETKRELLAVLDNVIRARATGSVLNPGAYNLGALVQLKAELEASRLVRRRRKNGELVEVPS